MKVWNRPIRVHYWGHIEEGMWGITNWMVGTCAYPWSPWVQVHLGRISVQIKWYVIVGFLMLLSFFAERVI